MSNQQTSSPQRALPFLPGYSFDLSPKTSHHKSQRFAVQNGLRVVDLDHSTLNAANQQVSTLLKQQPTDVAEDWEWKQTEYKRNLEAKQTTMIAEKVPDWVAYDRKVLRFYAYFQEPVHASTLENYRVRKCVVYFYLEDKTLHVIEPREDNSGITQGVFVKRHRVPKNEREFFSEQDLQVGGEFSAYGRVFRIVDCDKFTRDFYSARSQLQAEAENYPTDPFTAHSSTNQRVTNHKQMNPLKNFMEASLGKPVGVDIKATQQFLTNDRRVLRFFCTWNDESMYGEKRPFVLHYYLADDTVEVLEISQPNSGRDPFPALLKRQKLPKEYRKSISNVATIGAREDNKVEYYSRADFRVGRPVNVFGRALLVCDCDDFTRQFYKSNYGLTDADFPAVEMSDPETELPKMEVPPHNGFGTEEDSLGSFLYLVPKPPRRDMQKLLDLDHKNLRFVARFTSPKPEDKERVFLLTYYLADDTLSVYEKQTRNSGFVGGKFLERGRVKRPDNNQYFQAADFYVGGVLVINNYQFTLLEADEFTMKYMESHIDTFPKADLTHVQQILRQQGFNQSHAQQILARFKAADSNQDAKIDPSEFSAVLTSQGFQLTQHEILTIMRKFDKNNDGVIDLREFIAAVLN